MRTRLGTFAYPVEVGDASGARFIERKPLVDMGALYSQYPASFLEGLGHRPNATRRFRPANGDILELPIGSVPVRMSGETRITVCIFGAEDGPELLGRVTISQFGFEVDPIQQKLIPIIPMLALG